MGWCRTLVGEPPEDKLSDASNSPDYRNVSSPEDNTRDNKVSSIDPHTSNRFTAFSTANKLAFVGLIYLVFHSQCYSSMGSLVIHPWRDKFSDRLLQECFNDLEKHFPHCLGIKYHKLMVEFDLTNLSSYYTILSGKLWLQIPSMNTSNIESYVTTERVVHGRIWRNW